MATETVKIENYEDIVRRIRKVAGSIEAREFTAKTANHHLQAMRPRINRGINREGGKFPPYSTKPMYVSKNTPGLRSYIKPKGKTGRTRFANGKRLKSQYFPRGYAEFRRAMGLSNRNRLELRSQMLKSMAVTNYGREGSQIIFSRREENLKAAGNEQKYGFWGFTRDEQKGNLKFAFRLFQDYLDKAATR